MPDIIIESGKAEIVPGFEVKRILPYQLRRMVGPFIFMNTEDWQVSQRSPQQTWMYCHIHTLLTFLR